MKNKLETSSSLPKTLKRVSTSINLAGTIGFWLQLILGVISSVTLLFSAPGIASGQEASQGSGFGVFFAISGLIALGTSIYFSFRYTEIGKLLKSKDPAFRPNKGDTVRVIKNGLIINLVGLFMTILGSQAIVGTVLLKTLQQSPGLGVGGGSARFVLPIDMFVVQANTTAIVAHFGGLVISLWLLNRITK